MDNSCSCSCTNTKLCPTHKCRTTSCKNKVNITKDGITNYYCYDHLQCGKDIGTEGPCKGCLSTDQNKTMDEMKEEMKIN